MPANPFLEAALAYAERGWHVFPCHPGKKTPITTNGFKNASADPKKIRAWWTRNPDANVAIATGKISGLLVVDVDPRSGGDASYEELKREIPIAEDFVVVTGGGGRHYYLGFPPDHDEIPGVSAFRDGIDIKADRGYVIAPPSIHESGKRYFWPSFDSTQEQTE